MLIEYTAIKKILYINLAFIGDLLLSVPALRALRKKYPQADIHMLVTPWAMAAAKGNPYVDQIYEYDKKGKHRNIKDLWKLVSILRQEKYDLIISANFALRGALLAKAVGAKYRIGYDAQHAGMFLTHTVSSKRTKVKHESENQLAVLTPLGISTDDFRLEFRIQAEDLINMKNKIQPVASRKMVAICPYGRHPLKSWKLDGYVELLRHLSATLDCYLIGGKQEEEQLRQINERADNRATILAGKLTIGELAAFFSQCSALVTVDTGPMHVACSVGTPVIALFGRTDSKVWGPRGGRDIILKGTIDCIPCHTLNECEHHTCMKQITVDMVINAVQGVLEKE